MVLTRHNQVSLSYRPKESIWDFEPSFITQLSKMAPTLYMVNPSPPVRSVLMTAKAIGLELNLQQVNILAGEHKKPEYLKLNPQHTVPTLVDDSFVVWDSHAINAYLVSKYAKNDALYPKDIKKRAVIDQRLHFDSGVAFPTEGAIIAGILRFGKKSIDDTDIEKMNGVHAFLEAFLDEKQWMAGDFISIADYQLFSTVSSGNILVPIDEAKFPKLMAWYKKVEALPAAQVNQDGLAMLDQLLKSRMQS